MVCFVILFAGGRSCTANDIEWRLAALGAVETDLEGDPSKPIDADFKGIKLDWS